MTQYTIWNKKTKDTLKENGKVFIYKNEVAAQQALDDLYKHLELTGMVHLKGLLEYIDIQKAK